MLTCCELYVFDRRPTVISHRHSLISLREGKRNRLYDSFLALSQCSDCCCATYVVNLPDLVALRSAINPSDCYRPTKSVGEVGFAVSLKLNDNCLGNCLFHSAFK